MSRQTLTALFLYMPFIGMLFGLFAAVVISIPALNANAATILALAAGIAAVLSVLSLTAQDRQPRSKAAPLTT